MKVTAVIEKSSDDFYSIYTEENEANLGFGGYGKSVAEAKSDYMVCIEEMREMAEEAGDPWPESIEVEWREAF